MSQLRPGNEIFSDEFEKKQVCKGCKQEIDFTQCILEGGSSPPPIR